MPKNLTYVVIFVNHISSILEIRLCNVCIGSPHIADKIGSTGAVKLLKIRCQAVAVSSRQYINNPMVYRIGENTLIFFSAGISSEFVNGQHLRKSLRCSEIDGIKHTNYS